MLCSVVYSHVAMVVLGGEGWVGVGVICGEGAGCCGTLSCGITAAAAAAMLEFKCATSILVVVTSFLILATKL